MRWLTVQSRQLTHGNECVGESPAVILEMVPGASCLVVGRAHTHTHTFLSVTVLSSVKSVSIHNHLQCTREVFRDLHLFPHFVTLQPYSKMDESVFLLINLHTMPHNDKAKYNISISIQTLYSVLCRSTLVSDYSLESSWV